MTLNRIRLAAQRAGVSPIPEETESPAVSLHLDSLMTVLLASELEQEFKVRIPTEKVTDENFKSLSTLESLMKEMTLL